MAFCAMPAMLGRFGAFDDRDEARDALVHISRARHSLVEFLIERVIGALPDRVYALCGFRTPSNRIAEPTLQIQQTDFRSMLTGYGLPQIEADGVYRTVVSEWQAGKDTKLTIDLPD